MTIDRPQIDLRLAMNAVSDVVENRPRPLRQFDQIYMKSGDMLRQSEVVASWADGQRLAFIGDGDGISITVAHLMALKFFNYGPTRISVFDFDERIINSVKRFAAAHRLDDTLHAHLYNAIDAFPETGEHDFFYTNPPWGQHNDGESVAAFVQRGMESIGYQGHGMIVIADDHPDDPHVTWPQRVLSKTQTFALSNGFYISRMMPRESLYHLHDEHEHVPSCNLIISSLADEERNLMSDPLELSRLQNFHGQDKPLEIRYIRERSRPDYGRASESEYELERIGSP
jgi:predicted methyltransferase